MGVPWCVDYFKSIDVEMWGSEQAIGFTRNPLVVFVVSVKDNGNRQLSLP
jgi:hypothetical protein